MCLKDSDWTVRLERRSDGRVYWFDKDGNQNARRSSAMKMTRSDAIQFARAIRNSHKTLTAHACRLVSTSTGTKQEVAE